MPRTATAQAIPVHIPGTTSVGQQANAFTVAITVQTAGAVAGVSAVTQGIDAGEFTIAPGGTCAQGTAYTQGQACTVQIVFAPHFPGRRDGAVRLVDASGQLLGSTPVSGAATGPLARLTPGRMDTVAGDRSWIYSGDGVSAVGAPVFLPQGLAVDVAGNLFISDSGNSRIRRVDAATGLIATVVGTGTPGYTADGAQGTATAVSQPAGLALDGGGNLYFADSGNGLIRKLDAVSGKVTTVAGTAFVQGYAGDGGLATAASLTLPEGIAFDDAGNLLIADTGNNAVRLVDAGTQHIRTVAGTGTAGFSGDGGLATQARLNSPWSLLPLTDGSFLIADFSNDRVRKVSVASTISTVIGNGSRGFSGDGGLPSQASLDAPTALAVDPAGDLYIADSGNNRVRMVSVADGTIQTLAGNQGDSFSGDGGPANQASMYGPYALLFDAGGNLLVADMFHNRVRRISAHAITLSFATIRVSKTSQGQSQGVSNAGNADLVLATPGLTNAALDRATSDCLNGAVAAGSTCNLGVEFAPTVIGPDVHGSVVVNSNAGGTAPVISVHGEVLSVEPTSTTLSVGTNPMLTGDTLQLTAAVTSDDSSRSGPVTFLDGQAVLCTANLSANGQATCAAVLTVLGQHSLTASYAGDANNASSVSPVVIEVVKQAPQLVLSATPNPAVVAGTVTLRLTASAATGTPAGSVTFLDGSTALGSVLLNNAGVATVSTNQLAPGQHTLTAQYAGDATNAAGSSNTVTQTVEQATTTTTLGSSRTLLTVGETLTLAAQVSSPSGPAPTGTVTFRDAAVVLGTGALDGNGGATLIVSTLGPGAHSFTATYEGDVNSSVSTSAALQATVAQVTTQTVLATSANPLSAGAVLRLTATVTRPQVNSSVGALAGTVTFRDGSTVLGTDVLDPAGNATVSAPGLSVGTHAIVAEYSGNANHASSSSAALNESVASTPTTLSLSSSTTAALAGKPVVLTVGVASVTGIPTGTVTVRDGSVTLGQAAVSDHGAASFTFSSLATGSHTLSAVYSGDANYSPSTSSAVTVAVALAQPSLTLNGPGTAINAGTTATLTAVLGSNGVSPSGTLTLRDGGVTVATQAVGSGTVLFSSDGFPVGSHTFTVSYTGDDNNAPALSNAFTLTVQQGATTTVLTGASPVTFGSTLTLQAAVASVSPHLTGTATFQDGTNILGTAVLGTDGVAHFATAALTPGDHTLTSVYSGDGNHSGSTSSVLALRVVEASAATLSSSSNPAISGTSVTFSVRVAAAAAQAGGFVPSGSIIFRDNGNSLGTSQLDANGFVSFSSTSLSVGVHTIEARYSGDAHFAVASTSLIQSISNASTQITLSTGQNPATYATPVVLTASISSDGGTATGSVVFRDGSTALGNAVLNAQGVAQLTVSTFAPGPHTVVVSYAGDGRASASASGPLALVVKQTTALTLTASANPAWTLAAVQFAVTVGNAGAGTATGGVSFFEGSHLLGSALLDGSGRATLEVPQMSAGTHTITASYEGDEKNFAAQTGSALNETVQRRVTTTALTSSATNAADPQQVTLIALVQGGGPVLPGGTVTFVSGSTLVGTSSVDATGVATLTVHMDTKQESIVASYGGDASYLESSSPAATITAGAATQFTLQVNPLAVSVASKQHIAVTMTLNSVKGFSDTLKLGCLGLPFAATCTFSAPETKLTADGAATVQLILDTGDPLGAGTQTTAHTQQTAGRVLLCLLPAGLLLAFGRAGRKRLKLVQLLPALLVVALTGIMSGCSGLQMSGTPAGTYAIKVTASGMGTGATQSQTIALTVTQ